MVIQHNMGASFAGRNIKMNTKQNQKTMRCLSSGYRINTASDDAAGLTISEKMRWQIRGLNRASNNIQDGISLLQVADGALHEVHDLLQRMNELVIQGANDTNTDEDRTAIQEEINEIKEEINRVGFDTEYNTIKLFKETETPQIKGNPGDIMVYYEDVPGGGTREGGIVYSGKRYSYDKMGLSYDKNGNVMEGSYSVSVESDSGAMISLKLLFDGGRRVPSGREYVLEPSKDGISIDGILHPWNEIKDASGIAFNKDNIQAGTYSFVHAANPAAGIGGVTISFDVKADDELDLLINRLKKDGLDNYSLQSSDVRITTAKVNPVVTISDAEITPANQAYIPGDALSDSAVYKMYADTDGICLTIPWKWKDVSHPAS